MRRLTFQLNFSDFGGECEEAGGRNVNWLDLWTNATDLQYKPHLRGTVMFSLLKIISMLIARSTCRGP